MKKVLSIVLAMILVVISLTGCGTKKSTNTEEKISTEDKTSGGHEIVLITDKGNIDDKSFNQGAWEGVVEFAKKENISHNYIKPEEASDAGYLAAIDLAVTGGAKVIVTPGFLFEVAVYEAQNRYPDVKFILLDGSPHKTDSFEPEINDNVASVLYSDEQAGYLAGYAAVMDGKTNLGFMGGMAVPAVKAFGYGYIQGAEDAAKELELEDGLIKVTHHYTGNFDETDTNKATAKTMYQEGVEVIFACGGSVGKSVISAASEANGKVIGVDVDQRYDSETVMTSATKGLGPSVKTVLESIYKTNSWDKYSGKIVYFSAENDGVGLPTKVIGDESADAFDRFDKFTKEQYEEVYSRLVDGSTKVKRNIEVKADTGYATAEELIEGLNLKKVVVTTRQ